MPDSEAPEFSLQRPVTSALAVIRAVLFSPRRFHLSFSAEGSVREPAIFVLLVAAVTGALTAAVAIVSNQIFGEVDAGEVGLTALEAVLFALLSPLAVGVVAAVYLLSIRTFVGKVGTFREVYRMAAYAFGADPGLDPYRRRFRRHLRPYGVDGGRGPDRLPDLATHGCGHRAGELHAARGSPDLAPGHDGRAGLLVNAAYSSRSRSTRRRNTGSTSLRGSRP